MKEETMLTLNKILPVVERVHGEHHPELHQVAALYEELKNPPSEEIFRKLREVTQNYAVPADACPTYAKTYRLLEALDREHVC